ncbi:5-oxoprolinase subunit PxpB [Pedobacter nyackensis]|uniref:5-oxoprolinase subunit PxpB n=1 Tax=Pedobacter nyackensis TaxID=475255 RepID=UPI00292EB2AD|nr:5-oxoprolinase subunit PxpB [Pedobacter nyackensis]
MKSIASTLYYPLGDSAIVLELGQSISEDIQRHISAIGSFLEEYSFEGFIEYVPAFTTVTVFYDPVVTDYETVKLLFIEMLAEIAEDTERVESVTVDIPVLYGGMQGPDLSFVAAHTGLSEMEVIALHSAEEYLVYMIGFAPGFPYLGGLNEKIASPRKEIPSVKIPAGSVGIAGMQTGIYPIETPGGWQIIGQTPLKLFDPERDPPALVKAGNRLRFVAITEEEFDEIKKQADGN